MKKYTVEFVLFGHTFCFRNVAGENHLDAQKAIIASITKNIVFSKTLEDKPKRAEGEAFENIKDVFRGMGLNI